MAGSKLPFRFIVSLAAMLGSCSVPFHADLFDAADQVNSGTTPTTAALSSETSLPRSRNGGSSISNVIKRKYKSWRNAPSAARWARFWCVAEMTRKSEAHVANCGVGFVVPSAG